MRIDGPTYVNLAFRCAGPSSWVALAGPSGSLVVLLGAQDSVSRAKALAWGYQTKTIVVDRLGQARSQVVDGPPYISGMTGAFWSWNDSADQLHYIVVTFNEFVHYVKVPSADSGERLRLSETLFLQVNNPAESTRAATRNPQAVVRSSLGWTHRFRDHCAVAPMPDGSLLVIDNPGISKLTPAMRLSQILYVARFRQCDLSLINRYTVQTASLAGRDYSGVSLPQAILQRTDSGYVYFEGTDEGARTCQFDNSGNPVTGDRVTAQVNPAGNLERVRSEYFAVSEPGTPGQRRSIEWFGFTRDGELYHEVYSH